ncbi:hypothetical protein ERJ75_000847700 [Trypanosoma vivax]|nr:hypothetical protein TRVL_07321 [Trypanosoma vivax]KAH8612873.1 hypothetical protein ERJ75_000847700 [Trypanosoma vivax]
MRAMRAFVKNNARESFSFAYRPPADPGAAPADGFLRLENGELLLCFESQHAKFIDFEVRWFLLNRLRVAISPAHSKLQRNAFKMSGARWRRADPRSSGNAKRRGRKSTKNASTCKGIVPPRMVKITARGRGFASWKVKFNRCSSTPKSLQDANGMLAAEDGVLKAGRFRSATEVRGARA